jgi:2-amino-4-hydroxy-6-hydroxymethyldihydropteridine diphosphokinase
LRPDAGETRQRQGPSVDVFVSAGSNVAPEKHLALACRELARCFGKLRLSCVYRNPAIGFEGPDFLNLVVAFTTCEPPEAVVARLERLHTLAGRVRGPDPYSPRTLDLDLLLYGDCVISDDGIRVPHRDIERYAFVLRPLAELAPHLRHPVTGQTMAQMWDAFDQRAHPLERVELQLG